MLETNAPKVPELFLYSPNRAQVLPAFRAFVDIAREGASARKANA